MNFHPSEVAPDFQEDRLQCLAELFVGCRDGALEAFNPSAGETAWSLGCRSYERITYGIERLADAGTHPWLSIVQRRVTGEQFVFRIGTQPLKFYTGSPTRPTRSLRVDYPELRALNLLTARDGSRPERGCGEWRSALTVKAECLR
jgi:hypothetical protein